MRLRNKQTGKIIYVTSINYLAGDETILVQFETESGYQDSYTYESLEELSSAFEDYKPTEPLIKDEKIRKAVRAWAEACGVNRVVNGEYDNELCAKGQQFYGAKIVLTKTVALPRGRNYTIAELCGEEEE